jgi:hypothetical protein
MENSCFICGISAYEFQRYGKGFDHHINHDHNMWDYVYFMLHLRNKDESNYTAQESYVSERLVTKHIDFFPINEALVIQQRKEDDDQQRDVLNKLNDLMLMVKSLVEAKGS